MENSWVQKSLITQIAYQIGWVIHIQLTLHACLLKKYNSRSGWVILQITLNLCVKKHLYHPISYTYRSSVLAVTLSRGEFFLICSSSLLAQMMFEKKWVGHRAEKIIKRKFSCPAPFCKCWKAIWYLKYTKGNEISEKYYTSNSDLLSQVCQCSSVIPG